jgi:hypothetical protein
LKHLCWAMPLADSGSWLGHINILRRAEAAAIPVDEIPAEEPDKVIKLKFREHIEESLTKQNKADNEEK